MSKFLGLLALLALVGYIHCTCQPYQDGGQFMFPNNNLAIPGLSDILNIGSYVYNKLTNNGVSIWCKWFGLDCPKCQNLNSMSNFNSTAISGNWYAVASKNQPYDDQLACRRQNFAFSGNSVTWTTTLSLNNGTTSTFVNGNGAFVNGVLSLNGKSIQVLDTDYTSYMILHICDPSQGVFLDEFELLSRTNLTNYNNWKTTAVVFYDIVFKNHQNPFTLPFVGRCTCPSL